MADGDQGFALDEQAAKRAFDAHAARQLWAAVLLEQLRLVFRPAYCDHPIENHQARRWFGSADFREVCELAGFDHVAVLERVRGNMIEIPKERGPRPQRRVTRG